MGTRWPYSYVPPEGMVFERLRSEKGINFDHFGLKIGCVHSGLAFGILVFCVHFSNQFR